MWGCARDYARNVGVARMGISRRDMVVCQLGNYCTTNKFSQKLTSFSAHVNYAQNVSVRPGSASSVVMSV